MCVLVLRKHTGTGTHTTHTATFYSNLATVPSESLLFRHLCRYLRFNMPEIPTWLFLQASTNSASPLQRGQDRFPRPASNSKDQGGGDPPQAASKAAQRRTERQRSHEQQERNAPMDTTETAQLFETREPERPLSDSYSYDCTV